MLSMDVWEKLKQLTVREIKGLDRYMGGVGKMEQGNYKRHETTGTGYRRYKL